MGKPSIKQILVFSDEYDKIKRFLKNDPSAQTLCGIQSSESATSGGIKALMQCVSKLVLSIRVIRTLTASVEHQSHFVEIIVEIFERCTSERIPLRPEIGLSHLGPPNLQ